MIILHRIEAKVREILVPNKQVGSLHADGDRGAYRHVYDKGNNFTSLSSEGMVPSEID